jgi:hypothetical protein
VAKYKAESVHFRRVSSSMTPHQLHVWGQRCSQCSPLHHHDMLPGLTGRASHVLSNTSEPSGYCMYRQV